MNKKKEAEASIFWLPFACLNEINIMLNAIQKRIFVHRNDIFNRFSIFYTVSAVYNRYDCKAQYNDWRPDNCVYDIPKNSDYFFNINHYAYLHNKLIVSIIVNVNLANLN